MTLALQTSRFIFLKNRMIPVMRFILGTLRIYSLYESPNFSMFPLSSSRIARYNRTTSAPPTECSPNIARWELTPRKSTCDLQIQDGEQRRTSRFRQLSLFLPPSLDACASCANGLPRARIWVRGLISPIRGTVTFLNEPNHRKARKIQLAGSQDNKSNSPHGVDGFSTTWD